MWKQLNDLIFLVCCTMTFINFINFHSANKNGVICQLCANGVIFSSLYSGS